MSETAVTDLTNRILHIISTEKQGICLSKLHWKMSRENDTLEFSFFWFNFAVEKLEREHTIYRGANTRYYI